MLPSRQLRVLLLALLAAAHVVLLNLSELVHHAFVGHTGVDRRVSQFWRSGGEVVSARTPQILRRSAVMPQPPPQGGGSGGQGDGDGDEEGKKPKIELASLDEAAEKVSKTAEGVSDISRKANFEFRKIFGFDLAPVLGTLFVGWVAVEYVLKNTTFGWYLGF
eukprot:TRINITY_DN122269_c0_g1_i1.p1 TRINITY_DN122269_c0_g1~~TRINITY_DN122269_c0_g1_i1.p1  ORF type:complete len:163 (-),score=22.31 TRINITY_DN122269_c0_g1_i1:33-521(-)